MPSKDELKALKKLAKAEAKAAKKSVPSVEGGAPTLIKSEGMTPAERSAEAAERQLQFHKWRVILAAVSAIIALGSLILLLLRS